MDIKHYEADSGSITFKSRKQGEEFTFGTRALNLDDFTRLISLHLHDLEAMHTLYKRAKVDVFTQVNLEKFMLTMIGSAPALVAEIISMAADRPEDVAVFRKFPLPVSIQALADILRFTIEEVGGLDPLKASLAAVLPNVVPPELLEALKQMIQSLVSTGASEKTQVS